MKKVLCLMFAMFLAMCFYQTFRTPALSDKGATYRIYTYSTIDAGEYVSDSLSGERIFEVGSNKLSATLLRLNDYNAYETKFCGDESDAWAIVRKLNAKVVSVENGDTGINFYCFCDRFSRYVMLNGEKVNLHILVSENCVLAATPVIRGCI